MSEPENGPDPKPPRGSMLREIFGEPITEVCPDGTVVHADTAYRGPRQVQAADGSWIVADESGETAAAPPPLSASYPGAGTIDVRAIFAPMHVIDRWLRPSVWADVPFSKGAGRKPMAGLRSRATE